MRRALAAAALLFAPAPLVAQSTSYEQLQAFSGVLSQIRANYVDSVETSLLVRAAITGMLTALDPHSYYVSRSDFAIRQAWDDGRLAVTGMLLEDGEDAPTVVSVQPASPAERAGIMAGDRVLQVDSRSTTGSGARTVELQLLGEKGSKVRLMLERGPRLEPDTLTLTLKRSVVEHQVVPPPRMVTSTVGYVRLEQFTMAGVPKFRDAVKQLRGEGAKTLIVDLRGNPGGDVNALIAIANMFLPANTDLMHSQGRKKIGLETVQTKDNGEFRNIPLIVLIDEGSASASEMLAGALQDHDRALIVGRRSFGKALVQQALPLPNGDVVWLTTARIASPSGRVIQRSYGGVASAHYREMAGKPENETDTMAVYHTDAGRPVRGGGGITPDVVREAPPLPVWFTAAADTGLILAVADSVAMTLPDNAAARTAWLSTPARWDSLLVVPFLARVRSTLNVRAEPDPAVRARLGRILAARVAEVRWGNEAGAEFALANDPDVALATAQQPDLPRLLGPP
jgi:carboxyl-terminal processing protease